MSCIILKKKWSVISKLFPLNCIFLYISNWSKVLEFYLTSFFKMKSLSVKFKNFLDDFPVHHAALFINRTINNNYIHYFINGLASYSWWVLILFLDATRATLIPGTLPTLNLSIKSHPSSGTCDFPDLISVSNYHSYKEKTIKLLPYHSFDGGHIPPNKNLAAFP